MNPDPPFLAGFPPERQFAGGFAVLPLGQGASPQGRNNWLGRLRRVARGPGIYLLINQVLGMWAEEGSFEGHRN